MLKTYITPEEAEFLTGFPFKWKTLEQLADIKDVDPAELEPKLKELGEKGLLIHQAGRP
jgi:predicted transcriptional regulator